MKINLNEIGKLVINVAPVGGIHGKETNPNLPEQPEEIADQVYECYQAGASVVHLHVRDRAGKPTKDINIYRDVIERIKEKCDGMIIQIGFGIGVGTRATPDDRLKLLEIKPKPDMITIAIGREGKVRLPLPGFPKAAFNWPRSYMERFAKGMRERDIIPEIEVAIPRAIKDAKHCAEEDIFNYPLHFDFVLGIGGLFNTPEHLMHLIRALPENSTWQTLGTGIYQLPLTSLAIILGGHVRVGMEDNIYYRRGELLKSNAQLVERTVRIAKELERKIATVDEARKIYLHK